MFSFLLTVFNSLIFFVQSVHRAIVKLRISPVSSSSNNLSVSPWVREVSDEMITVPLTTELLWYGIFSLSQSEHSSIVNIVSLIIII